MPENSILRRLASIVILFHVASASVNLQERAQDYINSINKSDRLIEDWGLGPDYKYWSFRFGEKYPIKGIVKELSCDRLRNTGENPVGNHDEANQERTMEVESPSTCLANFTWNITNPMYSPFELRVNISVPMINVTGLLPPNITVEIDLNNASMITKTKEFTTSKSSAIPKELQWCQFSADIVFDGWFAYHLHPDSIRGDDHGYHTVDVGTLYNYSLGLKWYRWNELSYTLKGNYTQDFICDSGAQSLTTKDEATTSTTS